MDVFLVQWILPKIQVHQGWYVGVSGHNGYQFFKISFFLTWSNDCLWPHAGEGVLRDGYIRRVGQDVSICYKFILKHKGRALFPAHVSVIEIRTLPQQTVKKLIKINSVTKN